MALPENCVINIPGKRQVYNVPASFDIETTSFYQEGQKRATMYIWTFSICGYIIQGRSWVEFVDMCSTLSDLLKLDDKCRFIIYVHNLSYEFAFMCNWFEWTKVFAVDERKPVYAITSTNIEFRCSYILSGYSLSKVAENLHSFDIKKLKGDLDYNIMRGSTTQLTPEENQYCINDVQIVVCYILEEIENNHGSIANIPLTKTGYVRRYCRDCCQRSDGTTRKFSDYRKLMNSLTLEPDEYRSLKRAFAGGFTHGNAQHGAKTMQDIASYDLTSSYPTVMIAERFPMSKGEYIDCTTLTPERFTQYCERYCCIFDVTLYGINTISKADTYLSKSKCWNIRGAIIDNGRVYAADMLTTTITNIDWEIIRHVYSFEHLQISNMWVYMSNYLPSEFVKSILKLYVDKTTLKGIEGKEVEYMHSKANLNSTYGMTVTDICRPDITFTDGAWAINSKSLAQIIEKNNRSVNRFLFYPWGVFVTAYARRNLWQAIQECGTDFVYADTDSVKFRNHVLHEDFFNRYDAEIERKLRAACEYHKIDYETNCAPLTVKGDRKPMGVWDFEGKYDRFKFLGAKRYMTETNGTMSLTVSGVNKKTAVPYLLRRYADPFEAFTDNLIIPPESTGKLLHTYLDMEMCGSFKDHNGVMQHYHELSAVHLEPTGYSLSIAQEYSDFIAGIQSIE